jgi:Leucine-rich repeat (LRR) protein
MSRSPSSSTLAAVLKPYYSIATLALVLPPILPRVQRGHNRAFSLATRPTTSGSAETSSNPLLPQSTLPLSIVVKQPWAATLKILELSNRRGELLFELPIGSLDAEATPPEGVLPMLDELKMDGCGLSDSVPVSFLDAEGKVEGSKASKPLFQTLSTLFPSLSNLDLSHNTITSLDSISTLLVPSWSLKRRGLKSLRLQGNKITSLEGLKDVWDQWKDGEKIDGWRLEELDVRDNEIGRLEGEVGLLPLEAFLVEGNTFRVPARRVWEREGAA